MLQERQPLLPTGATLDASLEQQVASLTGAATESADPDLVAAQNKVRTCTYIVANLFLDMQVYNSHTICAG